MSYDRPYAGIRVVDLSQGIAGPYCAMLLAQHGADVVKVEPIDGDWSRILGTRWGGHTAYSIAGNLGKRAVALDLKSPEGRDAVNRLVAGADVFLEGFRPGVIERLGFGREDVARINPGIIYVSISGFGRAGPLAAKPAMDPVLQAFTGFMSENKGYDGIPHRAMPIVVDMSTALYTHQAVAAALYARRDDPRGRHIDASLMQGAANLQVVRMMASWLEGKDVKPGAAPAGVFPTADGWMQLVVLREHDFAKFANLIGEPGWKADPRFADSAKRLAHAELLNGNVAEILKTRPSAEWRDLFTAAGLQNEVVQDYHEFLGHPQVAATGLVSWLAQPGLDREVPLPNPPGTPPLGSEPALARAPLLGEHTRAVLAEIGYGEDEIAAMIERGVAKG